MNPIKRTLIITGAALALSSSLIASAQETDFDWLASAVETELQAQNTAGVSVAIVFENQVIFSDGFGVRNTETLDPVTADTLFQIGSTTKPLTALGMLQLAQAGLVHLDASVTDYLPEFAVNEAITVRQLLSHSAGLNDDVAAYGPSNPESLRESISTFTPSASFAPAGELQSYSNIGFNIAGAVIEAASGQFFADYMTAEVFTPLGMSRTTFDPNVAITYPVAVGYNPSLFGTTAVRPNTHNVPESPSGILYSTATNLTHLLQFILQAGMVEDQPFLTSELFTEMVTPVETRIDSSMRYGLGVSVETYRGTLALGHDGNVDGYAAFLKTLPEYGLGVVILANHIAFNAAPIFDQVVDELIDLPAPTAETETETSVDVATYADYVGAYVIANSQGGVFLEIQVSLMDDRLELQIADQPTLELRPLATDVFATYFGEFPAGLEIRFLRDETGAVRYLYAGLRVGVKTN